MYTGYFALIVIVLVFFIFSQLIQLNIMILKINKNPELCKKEIKEDKEWEFIKGLY